MGRCRGWPLLAVAVFLGLTIASGCDVLSPRASGTAAPSRQTPAPEPTRPSSTLLPASGQDIVVQEPRPRQVVSSPIRLSGYARVLEGTVLFEVADAKGTVVAKGFTAASSAAPQLGYFSVEVPFPPLPQDQPGIVSVFGQDPREGKRLHLVEVPVTLAGATRGSTTTAVRPGAPTPSGTAAGTPGRTLSLKVYFATVVNNDVQLVPVERTIPYTPQMGRASLDLLLAGPNEEEKRRGLQTSIPAGVQVKGLRIENGVAYADFDQKLGEGVGGSLRVGTIRRQITQTLLQFSTVREVVISIDGRSQDILQP